MDSYACTYLHTYKPYIHTPIYQGYDKQAHMYQANTIKQ